MLSHDGAKISGTVILLIVLVLLVVMFSSLSHCQETQCHDDEVKVTDTKGGYKCIPKVTTMEWPAKGCVKDFKPTENTKLIVPLDWVGNPDFTRAKLENFEFTMICPVVKQGGTR